MCVELSWGDGVGESDLWQGKVKSDYILGDSRSSRVEIGYRMGIKGKGCSGVRDGERGKDGCVWN